MANFTNVFYEERPILQLLAIFSKLIADIEGNEIEDLKKYAEEKGTDVLLKECISKCCLLFSKDSSLAQRSFNVLFAAISQLKEEDQLNELTELVNSISQSGENHADAKLETLINIFNLLDENSDLRCKILTSIIEFSEKCGYHGRLTGFFEEAQKWISVDSLPLENRRRLFTAMKNAWKSVDEEKSFNLILENAYNLYVEDGEKMKQIASEVIGIALKLPNFFNFDKLMQQPYIEKLSNEKIFNLLDIFVNRSLDSCLEFLKKEFTSISGQFGVSEDVIVSKMRLLVLADLAKQNIGKAVSYDQVANAMGLDSVEQVESWVIDGK